MSTTDDRALLEAAARSAGLKVKDQSTSVVVSFWGSWGGSWDPLADDGDALRLAVKLRMNVIVTNEDAWAMVADEAHAGCSELHDGDALPAARRAIVRAAAIVAPAAPEDG